MRVVFRTTEGAVLARRLMDNSEWDCETVKIYFLKVRQAVYEGSLGSVCSTPYAFPARISRSKGQPLESPWGAGVLRCAGVRSRLQYPPRPPSLDTVGEALAESSTAPSPFYFPLSSSYSLGSTLPSHIVSAARPHRAAKGKLNQPQDSRLLHSTTPHVPRFQTLFYASPAARAHRAARRCSRLRTPGGKQPYAVSGGAARGQHAPALPSAIAASGVGTQRRAHPHCRPGSHQRMWRAWASHMKDAHTIFSHARSSFLAVSHEHMWRTSTSHDNGCSHNSQKVPSLAFLFMEILEFGELISKTY